MEYYRRHSNISAHPKVVAAGFWGGVVFTALCDICSEFDLGGELPIAYCQPDYIVRRCNLWDHDCPPGGALQAVCNGMQRARVAGLIVQHEDGSTSIPGWLEHQPRMPLTSTERSQKHRHNMELERMQRNATQGTLPGVAATQERRGEERRVKDPALLLLESKNIDDVHAQALEVFEHWRTTMGRTARSTFDDKKRRAVERALTKHRYTVADLKQAVAGCRVSAFHQGHNDTHHIHDDLELICRDPKHIDQFIRFAQSGGGLNVSRGRVGAESQDPSQHELTPDELRRLREGTHG